MLVRSWNLFHGNTVPAGRHAYLDEMVSLATADDPDVLCLQEVPAWALDRFTVGDLAARPSLGPLPIPAAVGRLLTAPNHGLFRSLFAGQGNAMQIGPRLRVLRHDVEVLNPRSFRSAQSASLGLDTVMRLAWAKERRVVQAARLRHDDGRTIVVANMHCTSSRDSRIPTVEIERAARFALACAEQDDIVVLAGDFNVVAGAAVYRELTETYAFSHPGPWIDHVLVRGADVSEPRVWDDGRRARGPVLMSDHAPIEVDVR
ncbi:MAG TPA: endonuclease/exonuclease/phosphatase family protein [Gaiellaceae bacterium]|nr:endonuclease/exonuclease/phosphatase family protein [Gaiellaceae bacterium]